MQQKSVRSGQQQLEEDKQVEEIAGQEGTIEAHQQKLKERMKMRACPVPTGKREHNRRQRQDAGQEQHERGEPIENEDNSERSRPIAQAIDFPDSGVTRIRHSEQDHRDTNECNRCGDVDRSRDVAVPLSIQEQHACTGKQGQDDGRNDQICDSAHASGS
jgi:hypothetical protein